uniref:Chromosome 8 open reading frame 82 n=1 Tax=Laticauda laticaudata TaxID=8630 RepID=A0A8C5RGH7_LATLA
DGGAVPFLSLLFFPFSLHILYFSGRGVSNFTQFFCFSSLHHTYPIPSDPDHVPQLFLDDAKVKNFITCFKDKQFLVFFFKQLKLNHSGRYEDSFPYLSPCGREHNYIRCDDRPIVFTHLLDGPPGQQLLSFCGGADRLAVAFQPEKLVMLAENGRVYHPGPEKAGGVGLVKSSLAFELSPCFEYQDGPGQPPTHFHWQEKTYPLTNELLRLI